MDSKLRVDVSLAGKIEICEIFPALLESNRAVVLSRRFKQDQCSYADLSHPPVTVRSPYHSEIDSRSNSAFWNRIRNPQWVIYECDRKRIVGGRES